MTWTLMMMCSTATRSNWRQTSCGRDLAGWFRFRFPFHVSVSTFRCRCLFPVSVSVSRFSRAVLYGGSLSIQYPHLCCLAPSPPESMLVQGQDKIPVSQAHMSMFRIGINKRFDWLFSRVLTSRHESPGSIPVRRPLI
jgi:hypothetical protein